MKHARKDYNRIQDPYGLIPEDEPVFLLRGQDITAPETVARWIELAEQAGATPDIIEAARSQVVAMINWQQRMTWKVPDLL